MHKDFVPPVSIEEFAAYLDGNLTDDGMEYISSVISNNQNLADIAEISDVVDDITEQYILDDDLQLFRSETISCTPATICAAATSANANREKARLSEVYTSVYTRTRTYTTSASMRNADGKAKAGALVWV